MNLIIVFILLITLVGNKLARCFTPTLNIQSEWMTKFKENYEQIYGQLSENDDNSEKNGNSKVVVKNPYNVPQCFRDVLEVFGAAARQELWALQG